MKSIRIAINAALLGGAIVSQVAIADEPATPLAAPLTAVRPTGDQAVQFSTTQQTGTGYFRVGDVLVNKAERSISFPAEVNMDKGMLEYLLVHRKGKTHESLLRTLVEPYNLQVAFLLLGFVATDKQLAGQGDPTPPTGERVRITIISDTGPRKVVIPVEKWLLNKFGAVVRDVEPMNWVYSGSYSIQGRFMSQESGSIIAIWHDPFALIDNASPGGNSNAIWFVKTGTVPAVGTPVEVIITPAK